jgi:putative transposase
VSATGKKPADPYDNAKAESSMRTLKGEEVNAKTSVDREDARRQIGALIAAVYNAKCLHSALSDKPPVEFEAEFRRHIRNPTNRDEALSPN